MDVNVRQSYGNQGERQALNDLTAPELRSRPLCVLEAELDPPQMSAVTPAGGRKIVTVRGGRFYGSRLTGEILPGGADWALSRADGTLLLDVRLTLRTDDGALIYLSYVGMRHGPAEVMARLAGGERVAASEYYFRILPRFEAAADRYDWLNRIVAVGLGDRLAAGPRYTIFEIL
jgi:uncharacterized protein DUF3237